jgi:tetratricopeptide (TPR) repeat protein
MNPNSTHTELLNQYLDHELDASTAKGLEQQLSNSPELKEELDRLILARDAIKLFGLREQIKSIHNEVRPSSKLEKPGAVRNIIRWTLRVAAVLVLVIAALGIYEYSNVSADKLFDQQYEPFEIRAARGEQGIPPVQTEYENKNYPAAIEAFTQSAKHSSSDYFFVAQAYLHERNSADAVRYFELSLASSDTTHLYKDESEYYLALAYLKANEVDKAMPLFEKIHADPNHLFHDKVGGWFLKRLHWLQKK